jgi:hypothetical protein
VARVVLREFIEFFTSSSFDRLDFVFRFARGLRTVRERPTGSPQEDFPCGQSAVQSRTVGFFGVRLLLVWSAFLESPRVVAGRSATPSRTVRRSHTDSPHRLLQFRACASVLVFCFHFLSLGFLVIPLRLFEPCLGSCLCVWVHGVTIGV